MKEREVVYSPSEVQKLLNVDSSTLRKYAKLLEDGGYNFHKNERGHRGYFNSDIITLRKLINLSKQPSMTLERSVKAVMAWHQDENEAVTEIVSTPLQETGQNNDEVMARLRHLEKHNEKQELFNRALYEQQQQMLKDQRAHYEYVRQRDKEHDERLMQVIRTQQMLAATKESSFFDKVKRFFNRNKS